MIAKKEAKTKFPELKKNINSFLVGEEGKISKESILKAGVILAAATFGTIKEASATVTHTDSGLSVSYNSPTITGTHTHHTSHSSHSSHGSSHESSSPSHSSHSSASSRCCFPAGTKVSTPNGEINIEKIKKGDVVLAYDVENGKIKSATFKKMVKPIREGICIINKGLIKSTTDHPFYTKKKNGKICWAAVDTKSPEYYGLKEVMLLELGDSIKHMKKGWIEITSLEYKKGNIKTYCLFEVDKYRNFFANGFVVHNRGGGGGPCDW
jgi:hypothetical protein